jgi:hypothetical protein
VFWPDGFRLSWGRKKPEGVEMRDTGAFFAGILVGVLGWIVLGQSAQGRDIRQRVEETVDSFVDGIVEGLAAPKD